MTPASPKIETAARVSPYRVAHSLRDWARGSDLHTSSCRTADSVIRRQVCST
jgi:hypothetical protein